MLSAKSFAFISNILLLSYLQINRKIWAWRRWLSLPKPHLLCFYSLFFLLFFVLTQKKEAKEKSRLWWKKLKNEFIKLKFTKLALFFLAKVAFNNRHTAMNHCISMRSNSVNFLTLYSIIFFDVFFIKALFCWRHGVLHPQREDNDY